ncbi:MULTISPECIES: hypothetical protein [Enterobacter]|uniref:hypothetical protein n=1 Tax=Enterobacter TaxID=547 RepID=UPI00200351CD|nr:hypothetical protein [Enterobacter bugandensis]
MKKDDILTIFAATLRDSYESVFPDQAVYFARCLFLSAFFAAGRILLCRCRKTALSGNECAR